MNPNGYPVKLKGMYVYIGALIYEGLIDIVNQSA